jgi:transposase InsO family protein
MAFWRKKRKKRRTLPPEAETTGQKNQKKKFLPVEVKLLAAEACVAGLAASDVAEIVGSGPSTIQKWAKAYVEGGSEALMRKSTSAKTRGLCTKLKRLIEQYRIDNPEAGVRRIRDDLRRHEGVQVSAEKVRQVVNEAGLGNPPQPARRPPQQRRFEREIPNAMWQIDIFTFQLKRMYPVYLIGIIDDHSRYIVGHGLFRQQSADAVLEVVKGAIGERGAPREILSDNGRQFAAWRGETRFQKVLKRQGIQHVRSAPHHPMTLGKIERFWKTVWTEFLEEALFASFADASQRIAHWIAYYNHQRPHQGIDGLCPADRFYGIQEDVEQAVSQGCRDNSLRLALGQETRSPLFLLGRLGETDVRVTRKGDDIEVKVGDTIHEVIRIGAPYTVGENGNLRRGESTDEMEGSGRRGEVPGCGDGEEGRDDHQGDLRGVRGDPPGFETGGGEGGPGFSGGAGAEEAREEAQEARGAGGQRSHERKIFVRERVGSLEAEVRGGPDVHRVGAEAGAARAAAWEGGSEKKNQESAKERAAAGPDQEEGEEMKSTGYADHWSERGYNEDGTEK